MDAIVIAGGRGRRLGSLTSKYNKGALRLHDVPVLTRVVDCLRAVPQIDGIHIVTGYQSESIERLAADIAHEWRGRFRMIRGPNETIGMLQRIALAVPTTQCMPGALVMGVDSLIPNRVMRRFVSNVMMRIAEGENALTLLCATDTEPAPTHYLVKAVAGKVEKHVAPEDADHSCVLRSVGVRYLPESVLCRIAKDAPQWHGRNISPYITHLMSEGMPVHAVTMSERWVHIGYPRDFSRKQP